MVGHKEVTDCWTSFWACQQGIRITCLTHHQLCILYLRCRCTRLVLSILPTFSSLPPSFPLSLPLSSLSSLSLGPCASSTGHECSQVSQWNQTPHNPLWPQTRYPPPQSCDVMWLSQDPLQVIFCWALVCTAMRRRSLTLVWVRSWRQTVWGERWSSPRREQGPTGIHLHSYWVYI